MVLRVRVVLPRGQRRRARKAAQHENHSVCRRHGRKPLQAGNGSRRCGQATKECDGHAGGVGAKETIAQREPSRGALRQS